MAVCKKWRGRTDIARMERAELAGDIGGTESKGPMADVGSASSAPGADYHVDGLLEWRSKDVVIDDKVWCMIQVGMDKNDARQHLSRGCKVRTSGDVGPENSSRIDSVAFPGHREVELLGFVARARWKMEVGCAAIGKGVAHNHDC